MNHAKYTKELTNIFAQIGDRDLLDEFLKDLLTPSEYKDIVTRLQIVKMLDAGVSQRDIAAKLGVSISKVTRGSRELLDDKGGFRKILDTYYKK
ncbi:transcriptional regulator [Candidatus Parcubacteria bacterium]|nr:MAG: transcriptional regulator [Candidatus Parcubacteria bacterium]